LTISAQPQAAEAHKNQSHYQVSDPSYVAA
jgi:hypothetical protein